MKHTTIRLPEELLQKLKQLSDEKGMSQADLIKILIINAK